MLPRHLKIIFEINRRLLDDVRRRFHGDEGRVERVSLIEEGPSKHVRMANLAIVGSHSTNGVAAIHSALLRTMTVRDLAEAFPERFGNKTNGVTPRRWLLLANPSLATAVTEAIGPGWISNLGELRKLLPLADDASFREAFHQTKRAAKSAFAEWLRTSAGERIDPDSIFDSQIKRIHEYKRQLLNALRIVVLTSSEEIYDINKAYEMGANSFLVKPFEFENYTAMLRTLNAFWMKHSLPPQLQRPPKKGNGKEGNGHKEGNKH